MPTPHFEMMSDAQKPIWIPTMAFAAENPSIGNKYTIGYVHQLITVITCALPIFFAISGLGSAAVAAARPTRSSYTMYKKKDMEANQHSQRGVRSPVTTSSP